MGTWLHSKYCSGESFARLPGTVDNPDQRMAADVGRWAEELGQLSTVFAAAPLKVRHLSTPHPLRGAMSAASIYTQLLRHHEHLSAACCTPQQVLFYTHWMAQLTSASAVALVYLFFVVSVILQRCACLVTALVAVPRPLVI